MRILLDESLPRKFAREFVGHQVQTVPQMGWAHKKNGELLRLAQPLFDVFIIIDRGLLYQQNLRDANLAIILLRARSNRLEDIKPFAPLILESLNTIQPGDVLQIEI
ncbi:MAG: hypothetical protein HDKAJFGB_02889 [Anaerolineae bacterium]|nr:hypothetical protein [Anaerolineae bacterium]